MSWNINSYIVHKVHRCIKQPLELLRNCVITYLNFFFGLNTNSVAWGLYISHHSFCPWDLLFYISFFIDSQCRLNAWTRWAVVRWPNGHANLCMLCRNVFLMLKHWFCWKSQYNKYMFNFIDHLPVSGCVSKRSSALLCPRTYNTVDSVFYVLYPDV
jgi:hypothetical protein